MSTTHTRRPARAVARALAALLSAVLVALAAPAPALAMTTNKATARPNESGGSGIIGGMATRLTWEGTVGADEQVASVTLRVPEGGSFEGATTRVTVLDGLTRIPVDADASAGADQLAVAFPEPVAAGSLVRIEATGMRFPAAGGGYAISGSYVDAGGAEHPLPDSKPIAVIANTPLEAAVSWLDEQPWVAAWNSNQFLGMFLKPQLLLTSLASLAPGWLLCLVIVIAAYPFAIVLGLAFAFMKISRHRLVRAVAITYINVLRGTPLFLQIYIMFFGLPMVGINIDNNVLGVAVMAINSSAYLAEIFRAGIESIPPGQHEAASSLGMSHMQTMVSIILPQTVRRVIPTVTSDFITAFKDTSLLSSVGVMELMMFAKNLTSVAGNMTPYMTAAIFYLVVTLPLIKVVTIVEKRMAASERGGGPRPRGRGAQAAAVDAALEPGVGGVHCEGTTPAPALAPALVAQASGVAVPGPGLVEEVSQGRGMFPAGRLPRPASPDRRRATPSGAAYTERPRPTSSTAVAPDGASLGTCASGGVGGSASVRLSGRDAPAPAAKPPVATARGLLVLARGQKARYGRFIRELFGRGDRPTGQTLPEYSAGPKRTTHSGHFIHPAGDPPRAEAPFAGNLEV